MEWTSVNDLRETFLSFYRQRDHTRLPSFSLIPQDDNSLLIINSGMAPLKKYFMGQKIMPNNRATTCQKCIRTPDIERVGITARHGTFFEMLGDFSFGDYFKEDATKWAWELLTEVYKIPKELLYITVFEDDDEAWDIWVDHRGIDPSHMKRMGREDNFWEIGSGPCGPCSEIYFDRGIKYGCGKPDCGPGCDCDRFIEIWNLVFTQFVSDGNGHYERMAKGNIDTGMGLERLACVMQGVDNMFEIDSIRNVITAVENIASVKYHDDEKSDISIRVITDHCRGTVFMISDGIMPSNEGRGYVLRRLLRRAARHGRMIGIKGPFLSELADTVINESMSAYPELDENRAFIKKVILNEEERFNKTIDLGISRLQALIEDIEKNVENPEDRILSGDEAFRLNDTFGFPFDLTKEILEEHGIGIDEEGFRARLNEQAEKARAARRNDENIISWADDLFQNVDTGITEFTGYETTESKAKIVAIGYENELADAISQDEEEIKSGILVVLDRTPFYAEAGGQVADRGRIITPGGVLEVVDCHKTGKGVYAHTCVLDSGYIKVGETVTAIVDSERRRATRANHSSAHLLQYALRKVLGDHVHQAGSYVDNERLRFDFTHFSALSDEELREIESLVNRAITDALPVTTRTMSLDEAKKTGAIALFGEKYGDEVRVVKMDDVSTELCGGTHVSNTAAVGRFKIISEASVAAGVRRIEAVTSMGVLKLLEEKQALINETAKALKINNPNDIAVKAAQAADEARSLTKLNEKLTAQIGNIRVDALLKEPVKVGDLNVYTAFFAGVTPDALRQMSTVIKEKGDGNIAVICGESDGRIQLAVSCGKDAVAKGVKAGALAKAVATVAGGSGGGKPDFAMAGIKEPDKVTEALKAAPGIVETML